MKNLSQNKDVYMKWLKTFQPSTGLSVDTEYLTAQLAEARQSYQFAPSEDGLPPHVSSPFPKTEYRVDKINIVLPCFFCMFAFIG
jgi:hypothetical protein